MIARPDICKSRAIPAEEQVVLPPSFVHYNLRRKRSSLVKERERIHMDSMASR